jgi:hypothetical protein
LTRAAAAAVAIVLCLVALGCSGDDDPGTAGPTSSTTTPTGSIVPGGSTPSSDATGPATESSAPNGTGDPSAGIPLDQFCRGFREVRKAETSMAAAVDDDDVTSFKAAFADLTVAYQAMAENPPDPVTDALPAVFFLYEDVSAHVVQATSIDALKASALQLQADDRAEDLETVRDYGSANC